MYVHYNSGLHISTNGRAAGEHARRAGRAWPLPVEEIVLLGHSMGGLVARSACHAAEAASSCLAPAVEASWRLPGLAAPRRAARARRQLDRRAARREPLTARRSRGSARSAAPASPTCASATCWTSTGKGAIASRSASDPRQPLALPDGVACYAIAGTTAKVSVPNLPGDGLVSVDSALGRHARPELALAFPAAHTGIALGTGHLDLLDSAQVYDALRAWFS